MKLLKFFPLLILAFSLAACAPARTNGYDAAAVEKGVKVKYDSFTMVRTYTAPNIARKRHALAYIRAMKSEKTGVTRYQIYLRDYYAGDWIFYNSIYDSNGNRLDSELLSRDTAFCDRYGCNLSEDMVANISREYLEGNAKSGVRVKMIGERGEAVFRFPATYIKIFLSKVPES